MEMLPEIPDFDWGITPFALHCTVAISDYPSPTSAIRIFVAAPGSSGRFDLVILAVPASNLESNDVIALISPISFPLFATIEDLIDHLSSLGCSAIPEFHEFGVAGQFIDSLEQAHASIGDE